MQDKYQEKEMKAQHFVVFPEQSINVVMCYMYHVAWQISEGQRTPKPDMATNKKLKAKVKARSKV